MLLRGCAFVILTIVLLVAGSYVARGVVGAAKVSQARHRAAANLVESLPSAQRQATRDRERMREALGPRWGRASYSWQELVCELDHEDSGWIVENYTQECRIRSVELMAFAKVSRPDCERPPVLGPSGEQAYQPEVFLGPTHAFHDEHPFRSGCPDGIVKEPKYGASRLLEGHRPTSLDESPAWVVGIVYTDVSRTSLGCDPWAVPFCTAPVDEPILGDLDGQAALRELMTKQLAGPPEFTDLAVVAEWVP